jgi:protein-L-isoaspartate(D-aspartate) O-methyltransferase
VAPDPAAPLRRQLVEGFVKAGVIKTPAVARAMARVPRHVFVPEYPLHMVYGDRSLVTRTRGGIPTSSSSQPGLMASMLEMLRVRRGMRVLEIGAGTGYNAALLADLVGADGEVTAVDIQADVAAQARRNLRRAGSAARVVRGDGARGLRSASPFDRIIVTAGCWEIPRAWCDQLASGGILVIPLRLNLATVLLALRRRGDELVSFAAGPCGFMPMEGRTRRRARSRLGGRGSALFLAHDYRGPKLRAARLQALLRTPPRRCHIDALKEITRFPASSDFSTYMALQGAPLAGIGGTVEAGYEWGPVDTARPSLCLISALDAMRGEATSYGSDDAAEMLRVQLAAWQRHRRPAVRDLRARVVWDGGRLPELPQPHEDGAFRFGRGGASITLWYER